MEYIKPVILDLEEKFLESVKVIQGDTARSILFSILSDGKVFDLTGKIVRVYAIKPDGEDVYNELEIINATEGLAKLKLTSQMLAVAGKLKLILVISQGTDVLSSNSIFFTIDPTIKDDSALESTSEYSAFTTALSTAQSVETSFGDMLDRLDTIVDADLIQEVVAQYIQDNGVEITGGSIVSIVNEAIQNGEIEVGGEVSSSEISQAVNDYLTENPVSSVEIVNNLTTTTTGKALDASQGKVLKDALDELEETVNNLPSGGGSSQPLYLYYGYIPYVENNPLRYAQTYEDITVTHVDQAVQRGTLTRVTPAVIGKTDIGGVIPEGSDIVILIPKSSNLVATKDNGIGGKVPFATTDKGANGTVLILNGVEYEVYGEQVLADARFYMYVDNK